MTKIALTAFAAAFLASTALAQANPPAGRHLDAVAPQTPSPKPDAEAAPGCRMASAQMQRRMMRGRPDDGTNGKGSTADGASGAPPATRGMMAKGGMNCMAQAQSPPDHDQTPPKAK